METESTETTDEIVTLDGLIAWLEEMPEGAEYPYVSNYCCLVGQYIASRGVPPACVCVLVDEIKVGDRRHPMPPNINWIAGGMSGLDPDIRSEVLALVPKNMLYSDTFGGALARARAVRKLSDQP